MKFLVLVTENTCHLYLTPVKVERIWINSLDLNWRRSIQKDRHSSTYGGLAPSNHSNTSKMQETQINPLPVVQGTVF